MPNPESAKRLQRHTKCESTMRSIKVYLLFLIAIIINPASSLQVAKCILAAYLISLRHQSQGEGTRHHL